MKIGIRFADNDFYNTFMPFMALMSKLEFEPTKEQVVEMFNSGSYMLYLAFQNKFEYEHEEPNRRSTEQYLKINVKQVYLNDEVTKYIEDAKSWANGEFFVCDTDVYGNYVYTL